MEAMIVLVVIIGFVAGLGIGIVIAEHVYGRNGKRE